MANLGEFPTRVAQSPARKYLQIPLGGEGLLAHIALEGLVARVGAHVDLESGT